MATAVSSPINLSIQTAFYGHQPRPVNSRYVFPGQSDKPFVVTSLCHQHAIVRRQMKLSSEFVIHSLRHTMLTRLGEAGADSFTIKRIAGHSSVTVSERCVHPTPEGLERAFEKLERLNAAAHEKINEGLQTRRKGQLADHMPKICIMNMQSPQFPPQSIRPYL